MTRSAACRFSLPYHPWGINLPPNASISLNKAATTARVWGIIVPLAWVRLSAHPKPKDAPIFVSDKRNTGSNKPDNKRDRKRPKREREEISEEEEDDEETS